jgi:hypothetical protein
VSTVLTADDLEKAVLAEFAKWNKTAYYPTGATGPTASGKTDQSITTTQSAFTTAVAAIKTALSAQNYYVRNALSRGEDYKASDIIISSDSGFKATIPKMIFHIWGAFN